MTPHDTTHHTTHHMTAYTLGHHLNVAGREYLRNAEEILAENPQHVWLAETMLRQAEQALAWGNAWQSAEWASVFVDETMYDTYVDVRADDAGEWVQAQVARVRALVDGVSLPQHRNEGAPLAHSPQPMPTYEGNVSRETLETPPPPSPTPPTTLVDVENNDTLTATAEATATELLTTLIASLTKTIVAQVMSEVEERTERIAEETVENALGEYDPMDALRYDGDFASHVSDIARDMLSEVTFTVSVD